MKSRVCELDALRGLCILAMVAVHLAVDLVEIFQVVTWEFPPVFLALLDWGGVAFFLISGICATLGSHSLRRGLTVLGCGLAITLATWGMYALEFVDAWVIIWFGTLHCLGICMLLWPLFRRLPGWALGLVGTGIVLVGIALPGHAPVNYPWLIPLGITCPGFASSDYFPLLPFLGFFLVGGMLGRYLYPKKQSLLPCVDPQKPVIRFLSMCGRLSLPIYMLHQPVLFGLIVLLFP